MCLFVISAIPGVALAIPAPDLVINAFNSAAQLLGLSAAGLGAALFRNRMKTTGMRDHRPGGPLLLVMLALLLGSVLLNVAQFAFHVQDRTQRLHANLWRKPIEAGKPDALSIDTATLAQWLREERPINLIDVREPEETELGMITGAQNRRYADLMRNGAALTHDNRETVLLCDSGMRSGDLCAKLAKLGIPCRYLAGGYPQWLKEGRPLSGSHPQRGPGFQGLPRYPNDTRLLDTTEVGKIARSGAVQFIDVRDGAEFEHDHLPGALHIPLRSIPASKLQEAISRIPEHPVVLPCYDNRSCFYAKVLGLKLSRLGYDVLGRYTVPHEYPVPAALAERLTFSHLLHTIFGAADYLILPLREALIWTSGWSSSLAFSIILLAVALRLCVLPVALKAERDKWAQRRILPEIQAINERHKNDSARRARALDRLLRRERIKPWFTFCAAMLQLLLFFACFSAVGLGALGHEESFLWAPHLDQPDPLRLLPLLVAILISLQLYGTMEKRSRLRLGLIGAVGVLLIPATWELTAAANLYLLVSSLCILAQDSIVRRWTGIPHPAAMAIPAPDALVISLSQARHVPDAGAKAGKLARLIAAGLPVPAGFIVTEKARNSIDRQSAADSPALKQVAAAFARLKTSSVAVRSSGMNEDGEKRSFAGVYATCLNVRAEQLWQAIRQVFASYEGPLARSYIGGDLEHGGVIVQRMIEADYAGVLFTEHPSNAGCMLIELGRGTGDALAGGKTTPLAFTIGRLSNKLVDAKDALPIDVAPLVKLGRQIETLFGTPQDIEWAYRDGKYFILQTRDITSRITASDAWQGTVERERRRLLDVAQTEQGDARLPLFVQNDLSADLPRTTPLSLSLMQALWGPGGATDLACARTGLSYMIEDGAPSVVVAAFGQTYVNRNETVRRSGAVSLMAAFRLSRRATRIESAFLHAFLPEFQREMRLREVLDFSRFRTEDLIGLFDDWTTSFIERHYVEAEIINLAADFYLQTAERSLKKHGLQPALYLSNMPETILHQAMARLASSKDKAEIRDEFLALFGYRAVHDWELAEPRYQEDASILDRLIAMTAPKATQQKQAPALPKQRLLALSVERARKFQTLKEDAKHYCLRELALIRGLLLEIDARLDLGGTIFYLTIDELRQSATLPHETIVKTIGERFEQLTAFSSIDLPTQLSIMDLERLVFSGKSIFFQGEKPEGILRGTRVAGDAEPTGKVRILENINQAEQLEDGEILVVRLADPAWIPLFGRAAGVISEVGGWLSHAAIVAREYNIPYIAGVHHAIKVLKNGQLVQLCNDGTIHYPDAGSA